MVVETPKRGRTAMLYKAPFMIDEVGRAQVTAFVRRPGVCDGPSSSAIFELALDAPPLGKDYTASLIRNGVVGISNQSAAASGAGATSDFSSASTAMSATPTCQFSGLGVTPTTAPPTVLYSLRPTDLAISVCDASGAPIALADPPPTSAVVVLDIPQHGAVLTCKANVDVYGSAAAKVLPTFQSLTDLIVSRERRSVRRPPSSSAAASAMMPTGGNGGYDDDDGGASVVSGAGTSTALLAIEGAIGGGAAAGGSSTLHHHHNASATTTAKTVTVMSLGKTSSRADSGGALGITAPEIGVLSTARGCGISFKVSHIFAGAVGLDEPHNAEDVRRGQRREVAHCFHFAGDMTVSGGTEGFFKIADRTEPARAALETRTFRVGDAFSLLMRPSGAIDYIHNDRIIFTARAKSGVEALLCGVVRIAEETTSPSSSSASASHSITDMALVPPRSDQRFVIPSLIYNGPAGEGVLRVWLCGREFAPATARVRLTSSSLPKWAFSAFSVAAMFAVGALGCDGAKVAKAMVATESQTLQLFQTDPNGAPPPAPAAMVFEGEGRKGRASTKGGGGWQHQQQQSLVNDDEEESFTVPDGVYDDNEDGGEGEEGEGEDGAYSSLGKRGFVATRGPPGTAEASGAMAWEHHDGSAAAIALAGPDGRPVRQRQQLVRRDLEATNSRHQQQQQRPKRADSDIYGADKRGAAGRHFAAAAAADEEEDGKDDEEQRHQSRLDHLLASTADHPNDERGGGLTPHHTYPPHTHQHLSGPQRLSGNRNAAENPMLGLGVGGGSGRSLGHVDPLDLITAGGNGGLSYRPTPSQLLGGGSHSSSKQQQHAFFSGGVGGRSFAPPGTAAAADGYSPTPRPQQQHHQLFRVPSAAASDVSPQMGGMGGSLREGMHGSQFSMRADSTASLASNKRRALDEALDM